MDYATNLKGKLFTLIEEMNSSCWLFTKNPTKDFSRKKKWSFSEMMKFMISMEGKSLKDELYEHFDYRSETPSNSSFNLLSSELARLNSNFLYSSSLNFQS